MEFTVAAIATFLGGKVEGDSGAIIRDISPIENAQAGAITFLANPKYEPYIYTTGATAVIVADSFTLRTGISASIIRVPDPYSSFSILLERARGMQIRKSGTDSLAFISPSAEIGEEVYVGAFAYIGERAKIGKGSGIYPNSYVGDDVVIGEGTILYPNATIMHSCRIGKQCIIHAGTVIGSDGFGFAPQDDGSYRKIPQTGIVVLEDLVEIGSNVSIDRATIGETILRMGCKIDNLVQIAHNVKIGAYTVIAAQSGISGSSSLGENCMIGGQVGIAGHIDLADGTKVGAQSGVSKSVKTENRALRGSPARDLKQQLRSEAMFRQIEQMAQKIKELEQKLTNFAP